MNSSTKEMTEAYHVRLIALRPESGPSSIADMTDHSATASVERMTSAKPKGDASGLPYTASTEPATVTSSDAKMAHEYDFGRPCVRRGARGR